MYNPFTLQGKSILVTGASSGIGQSIAIACSQMGAKLHLVGRNEDKLKETLSLMQENSHQYHVFDLTVSEDIERLVTSLPLLNGVVHNAGMGSRIPCRQIRSIDVDNVLGLNTKSPILLQAELISQKKLDKGASVVFIASKAASYPSMGNAVYSASKGAIISYSKVLALELAARKIRVNCISPAMVWTDLIIQDGISKEELEISQLKYPLKRYGTPNDIAYLAIYMLSDASSWMTGSDVEITGGGEGTII